MMNNLRSTQGSALISALLIVAMVAMVATGIAVRLQQDIHRTSLLIDRDKRYFASDAVVFWAKSMLRNKHRVLVANDDQGTVMSFPSSLAHVYPGVELKGYVIDLQSRFNLNSLSRQAFQPMFEHLLQQRLPEMEPLERKALLRATENWIDNRATSLEQDEWNVIYTQQNPPYWSAHQLMKDVSEFRLVAPVTESRFRKLKPDLTVLPEVTAINLNTASKTVLQALGPGLTPTQLQMLLAARASGFKNNRAFQELLVTLHIPAEQVSLTSHYYLCVVTISDARGQMVRHVLLRR